MQAKTHIGENKRYYFDANGTSPLRPEVRSACLWALETGGNASSVHAEGRAARSVLDQARASLASAFGLAPQQITFTSGGSEANRLVLQPGLFAKASKPVTQLLVSATEHPSVLAGGGFSGGAISHLPVSVDGQLKIDVLEQRLAAVRAQGETALVSVMAANNETGAVQPVAAIGEICREHGHHFHIDAAQALGRMTLSACLAAADFITLTAHKAGGPVGAGALLSLKGGLEPPGAVIGGGGQERGLRAGTENLSAIQGFAALIEKLLQSEQAEVVQMANLQEKLESGLLAALPGAEIVSEDAPRLVNTTCLWHPDLQAEIMLMRLDLAGLAVSSGSACSSGKVKSSHVLEAMGREPALALRFSTSWASTEADVEAALAIWRSVL